MYTDPVSMSGWFNPPLLRLSQAVRSGAYTHSVIDVLISSSLTILAMGSSTSTSLLLLLLLLFLLRAISTSPVPVPPPCGGLYDCTSAENSLLTPFARLPDVSACRTRCLEDDRCLHFTFNYKPTQESLYPGACFLLTSCTSKLPGASQWVSGARDCVVLPAAPTLPRHFRDLVVLVRTQ